MTIDEIFSTLAAHMLQGVMFHEQSANCYKFLNLQGYNKCHEYHYYDEIINYRKLYNYMLDHHNKLIKIENLAQNDSINSSFYKYTMTDIDASTKRSTIRELMKKWVEWEKDTMRVLQDAYKELCNIDEIAAAIQIKYFLQEVEEELS